MNVVSKALLLASVAALSLSACSGDKGPGDIGSKDDIVVVNKGMPGAQTAAKAEGEDFTSTVEQAEAIPTPEVAPAENLTPEETAKENTTQAVTEEQPAPVSAPTQAPEKVAQAAPVAAPAAAPVASQSMAPAPDATPAPAKPEVASTPVASSAAPESAPAQAAPTPSAPATAVATPAPAAVTTPAPTPAPAPAAAKPAPVQPANVKNIPYPLDPNAPYSPKAMAAAAAAAGTPVTAPEISPSGVNLNDPAIIRSVQAKLAEKKLFVGPQTGMMSADLMNGIAQYQVQNNLAIGPLNEETLKHLGVIKE